MTSKNQFILFQLICFILEEFRNTGKLLHLHFFEKRMNIYYVWLCLCLGNLTWITYVTNNVVLTLYLTYILVSKLALCSSWEYNLCVILTKNDPVVCTEFFFFLSIESENKNILVHKLLHKIAWWNLTTYRNNLMIFQQDPTYSIYYISVGSSTCFGCWHPSSGAPTAVIRASGTD